jgi:hypothetical protein
MPPLFANFSLARNLVSNLESASLGRNYGRRLLRSGKLVIGPIYPIFARHMYTKHILFLVISVPAAFFVMLNVHEVGHTVFARLLGDSSAMYYLYMPQPGGGYCVGCNIYDEAALSFMGNVIVTWGGIAFTQAMAVAILFIRTRGKHPLLRQFASVLAVICVIDFAFQVLGGLVTIVPEQVSLTGIDMVDFIYLVSNGSNINPMIVKLGLCSALAAYLVWFIKAFRRTGVSPSTRQLGRA